MGHSGYSIRESGLMAFVDSEGVEIPQWPEVLVPVPA